MKQVLINEHHIAALTALRAAGAATKPILAKAAKIISKPVVQNTLNAASMIPPKPVKLQDNRPATIVENSSDMYESIKHILNEAPINPAMFSGIRRGLASAGKFVKNNKALQTTGRFIKRHPGTSMGLATAGLTKMQGGTLKDAALSGLSTGAMVGLQGAGGGNDGSNNQPQQAQLVQSQNPNNPPQRKLIR